jgi:hypothetical protein
VTHGTLPGVGPLAAISYWGGLNIVLLTGFVTRGWHGVLRARRSVRRGEATAGAHSTWPAPGER